MRGISTARRGHTTVYDRYRKVLLTPEEVKVYSRLTWWPPVRDTAFAWLGIVLAWMLVARSSSPWAFAIALPVIGSRYYALFIIGHDGLHRRLFRSRRANDLFNDLFIMAPIGAITRVNNANHIQHHEQLATESDPDRHKYACLTKPTLFALLAYVSGANSIFKSIRNVFFGGATRSGSIADARTDDRQRYTLRDLTILLGAQGLLIGGLTWAFGWWAFPLLWLVPVYVFMFLMDNFRTFAEHSHPESDAKADEHRLITYLANPIELMFFAPMNMNYHAVHHLWPSIPYYQLPAADRAIRGKPEAAGLEWRRSYLAFLLRYAMALPLEDCRQR
jgi:fatty acid desaturase